MPVILSKILMISGNKVPLLIFHSSLDSKERDPYNGIFITGFGKMWGSKNPTGFLLLMGPWNPVNSTVEVGSLSHYLCRVSKTNHFVGIGSPILRLPKVKWQNLTILCRDGSIHMVLKRMKTKTEMDHGVYEPCGSTLHDLYWAITDNS